LICHSAEVEFERLQAEALGDSNFFPLGTREIEYNEDPLCGSAYEGLQYPGDGILVDAQEYKRSRRRDSVNALWTKENNKYS
jgi:hypothetical protein